LRCRTIEKAAGRVKDVDALPELIRISNRYRQRGQDLDDGIEI
jgi:hypothetical protein